MLSTTTVGGERIAAIFPIIAAKDYLYSAVVVTTDDADRPTFTVREVTASGEERDLGRPTFTSLHAALRNARAACGWG